MKQFKLSQLISIEDLIELVKARKDRTIYYDVYSKSGDDFFPEETVFIDSSVQVDDDDKEIYPPAVVNGKFRFAYSGEQFQDVVDLTMRQKPNVTSNEIIQALNYYSRHDDFMDLD